jgi:hypothetical protein
MPNPIEIRAEWPGQCQRLVIKIGSAALAHPESGVDQHKIDQIIDDCSRLWRTSIHNAVQLRLWALSHLHSVLLRG